MTDSDAGALEEPDLNNSQPDKRDPTQSTHIDGAGGRPRDSCLSGPTFVTVPCVQRQSDGRTIVYNSDMRQDMLYDQA